MSSASPRVAIVGAGIAGAACLAALTSHGIDADLIDRGRAPGGRMSSPSLHGRPVDLGAAYFTVRDPAFAEVVDGWHSRRLASSWTSTLDVIGARGTSVTSPEQRWAAPAGLRSLVRDLIASCAVRSEQTYQGRRVEHLRDLDHDAVVLAMPDPQAARLAPQFVEQVDYEPVIAVAAGFGTRCWTMSAAAFVNDDPDVTLIADDGSRRGDGAAVLVIHTSGALAREHLAHPETAIDPAVNAARRLLGIAPAPSWTVAQRWTYAKPGGTHGAAPFGLAEHAGRVLGQCGDSWCRQGSPRIEAAWLSGTRLGTALAQTLG